MGYKDYKYKLFYGQDIVVNDYITIHQPSVRDIVFDYHVDDDGKKDKYSDGELGFLKMLSILTATPADYDVMLDDLGMRFDEISNIDMFFMLVYGEHLTSKYTYPLFGDLDFTDFQPYNNDETGEKCYIREDGAKIDNALYMYIVQIVREMFNLEANNVKWGNEKSYQEHLKVERRKAERRKKRHGGKENKPVLLPIISLLVNLSGFKYDRDSALDLNIYFLYDSLKQQLHNQQVDHLMTGVYVGLIDTSKMNLSESLNMIRKDW